MITQSQGHPCIDLEQLFSSPHGVGVLKVKGDSMILDHLVDGDCVFIERRTEANDGELVVARLPDGTATLRRWFRHGESVRLVAANELYEPILLPAGECRVMGVVIAVVRRYER